MVWHHVVMKIVGIITCYLYYALCYLTWLLWTMLPVPGCTQSYYPDGVHCYLQPGQQCYLFSVWMLIFYLAVLNHSACSVLCWPVDSCLHCEYVTGTCPLCYATCRHLALAETDDEMCHVADLAQVFKQVYNTVVNCTGISFSGVVFYFTC